VAAARAEAAEGRAQPAAAAAADHVRHALASLLFCDILLASLLFCDILLASLLFCDILGSYDVIVKIDTWADTPLRSHSAVWRKITRERLLKGLNGRARLEVEGEGEGGGAALKSSS
jgi:hypothetical protein